jgi:hypothetical protein
MFHHNDFVKEDDKTLKSHSPKSYVNMPLLIEPAREVV